LIGPAPTVEKRASTADRSVDDLGMDRRVSAVEAGSHAHINGGSALISDISIIARTSSAGGRGLGARGPYSA
jgi:hypothetical protein